MATKSTAVKEVVVAASDARHNLRDASQFLNAAREQCCDCGEDVVVFELIRAAAREVDAARALLDKGFTR